MAGIEGTRDDTSDMAGNPGIFCQMADGDACNEETQDQRPCPLEPPPTSCSLSSVTSSVAEDSVRDSGSFAVSAREVTRSRNFSFSSVRIGGLDGLSTSLDF